MGGLDHLDSFIYSVVYIGLGLFVFTTVKQDVSQSLADLDAVQASLKAHLVTAVIYSLSYVTGLGVWLTGLKTLFVDQSLGLSFHAVMMIVTLAVCLVVPVTATDSVFERSVTHKVSKQASETSPVALRKVS